MASAVRLSTLSHWVWVGCLTLSIAGNGFCDTWQAGVAKTVITPKAEMWMAGYAHRDRPAEGTLSDLWAKSLCLQDAAGHRVVVVTLDLIGVDRTLSRDICDRLERQFALSRSQIALCTSHTHTGPVVARNLESMHFELLDETHRKLVMSYADRLVEQVVGIVGESIDDLQPADVLCGSGISTFAVNRRNNSEAQVPELRAAGRIVGPFDHSVPVLVVRSLDGVNRALVFGYACHATTLSSYQWSGDYAGFAQETLERDYPGATAMFWAGCGGDQNPIPRRDNALALQYGHELASSVKSVLEDELQAINPTLQTAYQEIDLPFDALPDRPQLNADVQDTNPYVAARAKILLRRIEAGQPLSPTYPYPIGIWRLGDQIEWIFLGGEVVVDYALRLKQDRPATRTWIAAYANDVMAYIPSRRVLREGGYEGGGAMIYYGLPTHWAPEVERLIVEAVTAQRTTPASPTIP